MLRRIVRCSTVAAVLAALLLTHATATRVLAQSPDRAGPEFPPELVDFVPLTKEAVFAGSGGDTWDRKIRERGYILRENGVYSLWYTGYNDQRSPTKFLGLATSPDGLHWTRYSGNPLTTRVWTEDMCVVKQGDTYFMFAEGLHDVAHLLTSTDRIHWQERGSLDVRQTNGKPLAPGPYGTPAVWVEGPNWYLFYERGDRAVWLARSTDCKQWTNVQDEPVLRCGPEPYDRQAVAMNQILKYRGRYYGYYHSTGEKPWRNWTSSVAMSTDLVHWKKYPKNPIVTGNRSSPVVVFDGRQYRLYTMHPDVRVYGPRVSQPGQPGPH